MEYPLDPSIRVAVRALIVRDDKVLVQRKAYEDGSEKYTLPGGAPLPEETLEQALERECLEEINVEVIVQDLVHVADYFKQRSTVPPTIRHQVEMIFRCDIPQGSKPQNGSHPDKNQVAVEWVDKQALEQQLSSPGLGEKLFADKLPDSVYLGSFG